MKFRFLFTQIVLWLFVIFTGIVAGGSLFEGFVLTPLWDYAPPESVISFPYHGIQGKFFLKFTPLYGLSSLILFFISFFMPRRQLKWALAAGLTGIVTVLATMLFSFPFLCNCTTREVSDLAGKKLFGWLINGIRGNGCGRRY